MEKNVIESSKKRGNGSKSNSSSPDLYHVKLAFILSLMAWPVTYFLNNGFERIDQSSRAFWMMSVGFILLLGIILVVSKLSQVYGWLYYELCVDDLKLERDLSLSPLKIYSISIGMVLFTFTCMIDTIIALEYHGFISGFMSEYLKMGEPYLHSPYGSAISLFDGIGFYFMYLLIIYQISNGKSWRSMGIYWGTGIINSMIVLVFGVFTGKHNPTFCLFLNVPYVVFPIVCLVRAFGKEKRQDWNLTASSGFLLKIFDLVLAIGLIGSMWVCMAKGLLSIGSQFQVLLKILLHEPALLFDNPAPFLRIQSLIFFFYIVPIQFVSFLYIFSSKKPQFLWDMSLLHSGVMLQAQFSFFFTTLDRNNPKHVQSNWMDQDFWLYNLLLVIVPHLYLLRLLQHRRTSKKYQ